MKLLYATQCCWQKFHGVYVRETCFKIFLELHETVSSIRTLLSILKLVLYFSRLLANHSSAISEGQFTCNSKKAWWAPYAFLRWIHLHVQQRRFIRSPFKCVNQTQWDNSFFLLSKHHVDCFVWFESLRPINNILVTKGRDFLGWTSNKLG